MYFRSLFYKVEYLMSTHLSVTVTFVSQLNGLAILGEHLECKFGFIALVILLKV